MSEEGRVQPARISALLPPLFTRLCEQELATAQSAVSVCAAGGGVPKECTCNHHRPEQRAAAARLGRRYGYTSRGEPAREGSTAAGRASEPPIRGPSMKPTPQACPSDANACDRCSSGMSSRNCARSTAWFALRSPPTNLFTAGRVKRRHPAPAAAARGSSRLTASRARQGARLRRRGRACSPPPPLFRS